MSEALNKKQLAKNTAFMYFRMLFLMAINLYVSRVTLRVLGVDDFGIYNVVSGIVVLFSFISNSMSGTCTRYMSFSLTSKDKGEVQKIFSNALVAHLVLAGIVVLLLETVGLWLVIDVLNLPDSRRTVAYIIYQVAIVSVCFGILRIPFNSSIIAHEHMDFFAYSSIVEGVLKLLVVLVLTIIPYDRLITYSVLLLLSAVIINIWYVYYCLRKFEGNNLELRVDKKNLKEFLTFSGWNMVGGISDMTWQQGTSIILNMFFGVALNAAMGITDQVRSAVRQFVTNLQTAITPQIHKTYSAGEKDNFFMLVFALSKYSFYLMLLIAVPIIINVDFILDIWLEQPPKHATSFVALTMLFCLFDSVNGPLWVANQATGDVRDYNIWTSVILLLNMPAAYLLFRLGYPPESMLVARIVLMLIYIIFQVALTKIKTSMSLISYIRNVIGPIIVVFIITVSITYFSSRSFNGLTLLIVSTSVNTVVLGFAVYFLGINFHERQMIKGYVQKKVFHKG